MKNTYQLPCNIAQALNIIGDKWTLLILHQLMQGHDTYKELQENLEGIPSNLLSDRLKNLEQDHLITTNLYQAHPPRFRYFLTDSGNDLNDVFNSIILWGEKNLQKCHKQLRHKECSNQVQIKYYCSHCDLDLASYDLEVK